MGHKFLLKSDPIHPNPTDAGHDAGHDADHSLCFLDIYRYLRISMKKGTPRDEILEPGPGEKRFRCDSACERSRTLMTSEHSGCVASENSSCCKSSDICRTVYRNSMHIFLRFNSVWCTALQQRWWSAQVGSSWPSWGKDRAVRGRGEAGCTVFVFDAFVSSFPTLPCFLGIFSYIRYRWYSTSSAMSCF
jgi:hypothetical protein